MRKLSLLIISALYLTGCSTNYSASPDQKSIDINYIKKQTGFILQKTPSESEFVWRCNAFGLAQYLMFSKNSTSPGNGQNLERKERLPLAQHGLMIKESFSALRNDRQLSKLDPDFNQTVQNTNYLQQGANSIQLKQIIDSCTAYISKPGNTKYHAIGLKAAISEIE